MGPASHRAIKEGEITLPHDTLFVLSEVNGEKVYRKRNEQDEFEVMFRNKKSIGELKGFRVIKVVKV